MRVRNRTHEESAVGIPKAPVAEGLNPSKHIRQKGRSVKVMEFEFSAEERQFQEEVDEFVRSQLPSDWDDRALYWPAAYANVPLTKSEFQQFQKPFRRALGKKGWLSLGWPLEYGGEASRIRQAIVDDITCYYLTPVRDPGSLICGPIIIALGSEEMKKEFLPRIAKGEITFWLGYSEPDAGSDIAALRTTARKEGDHYVINGQKIWSSGAHVSDYGWLIARTDEDAPKHKGLTLFIVDNQSPGIDIRPIINICGTHSFNEVFFDNVRVPASNVVGTVNHGFKSVMLALEFERLMAGTGAFRRVLEELVDYAKKNEMNGRPLALDQRIRSMLAQLATDIEVLYCFYWRTAWLMDHGRFAGREASALKLYSTELSRKLADAAMEIMGEYGLLEKGTRWTPLQGRIGMGYLDSISGPIGAGTSEIQRSIIATRGLGLPVWSI